MTLAPPLDETFVEPPVHAETYAVVYGWILDAEISDRAVRLYAVLQQFKGANDIAWPSRKTLAERLHCSIDSIDRAIAELVGIGAVVVERRHREDRSLTSSTYWLWPRYPQPGGYLAAPLRPGVAAPVRQHEVTTDRSNYRETSSSAPPDGGDRPEAQHLANLLADLIAANGSKRPNVTKTWVTDMDRMLRLDGRDPAKAERLLRWCQADDFWRANILSPAKFRAKYDQMRLRANAEARKAGEAEVDNSHSPRAGAQPPPADDILAAQERARAEAVPMPEHLRDWKRQRGHK